MTLANAIRRAVPVLAQHGHVDPEILKAWLLRAGLSKEEAHDAVRFIPLALAGSGVSLPDTYIRVVGDQQEERPLKDEPFFRGTSMMAPSLAQDYGAETLSAIVIQSAEFQAVNNALNAGSNLEDLVGGPPLIECDFPAPPPPPWWKFWA